MFSVLFPLFLTEVAASLSPDSRCLTEADLQSEASPSLVQTLAGPLLGLRQTETDPRTNQTVSWTSYFDIPYAQPPLGPLRFHPPLPVSGWSCLRDARASEDKICPQVNINFTLSGGGSW